MRNSTYCSLVIIAASYPAVVSSESPDVTALNVATQNQQKIKLNENISDLELQIVGPGNPYNVPGKEALFQLAVLYLDAQQVSMAQEVLEKLQAMDAVYKRDEVQALLNKIKGS